MRILFVVSSMPGIGGIESSLINLINGLAKQEDYQIDLCVLGNIIKRRDVLDKRIHVIPGSRLYESLVIEWKELEGISTFRKIRIATDKILRRLMGYKRLEPLVVKRFKCKERYDCAVSYSNNIYFNKDYFGGAEEIVLNCINANKKIAWIHNEPQKQGITKENSEKRYSQFDFIINVSNDCKKKFDEEIPSLREKSRVCYNIIDTCRVKKLAKQPLKIEDNKVIFVTVARLENKQKRIDKIIECVEKLNKLNLSNFVWYIVGDGPDKKKLEDETKVRNLSEFIIFAGQQLNPYTYMKNADYVVMTSDYESFGIVLIEALALNKKVIATYHPGIEEIIQDRINGIITEENSESLYHLLRNILQGEDVFSDINSQIPECLSEQYIIQNFDSMIKTNADKEC